MRVLIVENELYLAQSIAAKLMDMGYTCEFASTLKEAQREDLFDVILLSTNIPDQNFYPVINMHKKTIIILMVSYINNDTVSKPLKAGASDYILKPFMIEELVRKIEHFKAFQRLKEENRILNSYIEYTFSNIKLDASLKEELPLLIKTNNQKNADYFAYSLSSKKKLPFEFIALQKPSDIDRIKTISKESILYLLDFQNLKKIDKTRVIESVKDRNAIIFTNNMKEDVEGINTIEIKTDHKAYEDGDVLSIEEYVKHILVSHQKTLPDTELSKKLGISRKSLWEKRKKYGIVKKDAKK